MTQQTMTKEQILETYHRDEHETIHEATLTVMELYAQQEVAKEREKAKNLIIDAKRVLELYAMSKSGRLDGWPSHTEWELATGNLKQSLTEYEKP